MSRLWQRKTTQGCKDGTPVCCDTCKWQDILLGFPKGAKAGHPDLAGCLALCTHHLCSVTATLPREEDKCCCSIPLS
eukprot:1160111-Pelagomonas_calceolata.AAC.7